MGPGQRIRYTRWRPFQRVFSDGSEEKHYIASLCVECLRYGKPCIPHYSPIQRR